MPSCLATALWICRLVRVLLGADAISERKLETGNPLVVLGVQIESNLGGVVFFPAAEKVEQWKRDIKRALREGRLTVGEASKLAGASIELISIMRDAASVLFYGRPPSVRRAVHLQTTWSRVNSSFL